PAAISIEILDSKGELVRRFASDEKPKPPDLARIQITPDWVAVAEPPGTSPGGHRFVWDLHYALPEELQSASSFRNSGAWAPPGRYAVRLTAAGTTWSQPLVVAKDPRITASDGDLLSEFRLVHEVQAERVRIAAARRQAEALRKQAAALHSRAVPPAADELTSFEKRMEEIAGPSGPPTLEELFGQASGPQKSLRRLSTTLARFQSAVESADAAPTADALAGWRHHRQEVSDSLAAWRELLESGLARLNRSLESSGLSPLTKE
ncbi:MAG TPA: hypothetical protein VK780_04180, partial [Thermoanaerobaculia bacterium]|nr:hypothetical protein [Thermoanaerobaculia bacterium]